jgi:hypothetical protein
VGNLRRNWAQLSFEKKLSIVVIPLLLATIAAGIPLLAGGGDSSSTGSSESDARAPRSNLEIVDLAVTGGSLRGDPKAIQTIDVTVRNAGDLVSVVKRMGFRVRATALLKICQAGGGLEASEGYKVILPPDPEPGQLVEAKVSQQIGPGRADRFTLGLDVPEPARQYGDRLYQLDVLLYHDTMKRPVHAGTVVAAAPYLPDKSYFWSGQINPKSDEWGGPDSPVWQCFDNNEAELERMLALRGQRSPELSDALLRRD